MQLTFIGDVMLARLVGRRFHEKPYQIVSPDVLAKIGEESFVIGNLEAPIVSGNDIDIDHMTFRGEPDALSQFSWVNLFSVANNHINDCGNAGIDETLRNLDKCCLPWTGLFKNSYQPYLIEQNSEKIAVISLTDMLNYELNGEDWHVLRMESALVTPIISEWKQKGYSIILFAHVGALFTRFPNPITRRFLHSCVDAGCDLIVTVHSHVLGGMEIYKNVPIFHSLGDFIMDGASYRRRCAGILQVTWKQGKVEKWDIIPVMTDQNLQTRLPSGKIASRMLKSFKMVSDKIQKHSCKYDTFYRKQYRIELFFHMLSTVRFLLATKGFCGTVRLLYLRMEEVLRTVRWALSDRSNIQRDDDALKKKHHYSTSELFK